MQVASQRDCVALSCGSPWTEDGKPCGALPPPPPPLVLSGHDRVPHPVLIGHAASLTPASPCGALPLAPPRCPLAPAHWRRGGAGAGKYEHLRDVTGKVSRPLPAPCFSLCDLRLFVIKRIFLSIKRICH